MSCVTASFSILQVFGPIGESVLRLRRKRHQLVDGILESGYR